MNHHLRLILGLTGFLGTFSPSSGLAELDTGRPTSDTPYNRFLDPMRKTFGRFHGSQPSVDEVRAKLRTARRFRYYFDSANPYVPVEPETTDSTHQGDCKAKSLWLAWKMDDRRLRFVIGKASRDARISHAWLLWDAGGVWYALDPTMESDLLQAERIAGRKLFPNYSYTASGSYSHLPLH